MSGGRWSWRVRGRLAADRAGAPPIADSPTGAEPRTGADSRTGADPTTEADSATGADPTTEADSTTRAPSGDGAVLLRAVGLSVVFDGGVRAVDGVDLELRRGETLGLVGESGCGKSTLGNALLRLVEPTGGRVELDGRDLTTRSRGELRRVRRRLSLVFQDPYASLDPRRPVGHTIAEPLVVHGLHRGRRGRRVAELLGLVGLAATTAQRYPHELSGGQRQRIGIARALAGGPDLLVCDEAVASLDVSVQAQVLTLLRRLQRELGLAMLFISHDVAAVRHVSDRIAVMYLGRLVEIGPAREVVAAPRHPYTEALLSAVPRPDPATERRREPILLRGDPPSPRAVPTGCRFRTRCPVVFEECERVDPTLTPEAGAGHRAACLRLVAASGDPTASQP